MKVGIVDMSSNDLPQSPLMMPSRENSAEVMMTVMRHIPGFLMGRSVKYCATMKTKKPVMILLIMLEITNPAKIVWLLMGAIINSSMCRMNLCENITKAALV